MHRGLEKDGIKLLTTVKPVLADMGTYLHKAIPDTKMTILKYADAKFTYLAYCLKIKEMDDEEHNFASVQEPLYRVETGNYEYRLILRCRQEARAKFARLRGDVLEKIELLESKHARDLTHQLRRLIDGMTVFTEEIKRKLQEQINLFPIEVDLKSDSFQYSSSQLLPSEEEVVDTESSKTDVADLTETVNSLENLLLGDFDFDEIKPISTSSNLLD